MFLAPGVVQEICERRFFNPQRGTSMVWGVPTLDVFAGPLPGEHVASQYYTKYWCEGSLGADAFMHAWDVQHPWQRYHMAWIFPPQELIVRTLVRLQRQPVHATLVLPNKVAMWTSMLPTLPIIAKHYINPREGTYRLGVGAPAEWRAGKPVPLVAWRLYPGLRRCVDV